MQRTFTRLVFLLATAIAVQVTLPSCASRSHCPAIAGTGNSATHKGMGSRKSGCAGVKGTGNYKPKVKNKREDGLTSAKMEREIARDKNKKAGPIESRKLSVDQ